MNNTQIETAVCAALADGPKTNTELHKLIGASVSRTDIQQAVNRLRVRSMVNPTAEPDHDDTRWVLDKSRLKTLADLERLKKKLA